MSLGSTRSPDPRIELEYSFIDERALLLLPRPRIKIKDRELFGLKDKDSIVIGDRGWEEFNKLTSVEQASRRKDYQTLIDAAYDKIPRD